MMIAIKLQPSADSLLFIAVTKAHPVTSASWPNGAEIIKLAVANFARELTTLLYFTRFHLQDERKDAIPLR